MCRASFVVLIVSCCGLAHAAATRTAEFQAKIDAAWRSGGGRVVVPAGEWTVGTLWLKSNVELHLEKGAVLNASLDKDDYNANDAVPLNFWSKDEEWSGGHLILCNAATNVAITGEGTLHGHGSSFFGGLDPKRDPAKNPHGCFPYYRYGLKLHPKDRTWFRPGPMLAFFVSKDVRLEGVTIRESPCWTVHFRGCDGVDIRNVSILNDRTIANSDGFSIDCTRNVRVADCRISTGDDGFAIRASGPLAETHVTERIRVRNCRVASCCFGARIGIGTGMIRDVSFEDCDFEEAAKSVGLTPAWGFAPKYVSIEDIVFRNCTMRNAERPLEAHVVPRQMGTRNVTFDGCRFEALSPILLPRCDEPGFCENNYLKSFLFRNCTFKALKSVPGMRTTPMFKGPEIAEKGYVVLDGEGWDIRFEGCDFPVRYVDPAAPRTWWHWMNGNVSKEGITADLEAMSAAGLGGATIFDADCGIPSGPVDFASEAWFDAVDHAGREAKRLGLELTLANCSGWSSTGGPWVPVEESMKMTTLSELRVKGGGRVALRLPQPTALGGFYRDIAVFAVPLPPAERRDAASAKATVTAPSDLERIFSFDAPFAAASVRCDFDYTPVWCDAGPMSVSASDDGVTWREVHKASVWLSAQSTGFFQPRYYPLSGPVTAKHFKVVFAFPGAGGVVKLKDCSVEPRTSLLDLYAKAYCRHESGIRPEMRRIGADRTVRPGTAVDLTGKMKPDGALDWDAPAGEWQVVRLGYTSTRCRNHPATPKGRGFEADKFDARAMARHFDAYVGKVLARAGTNSAFKAVLIDSCETGSQNWTAKFPEEFLRRRGYEMASWYPVLAGFVVGSVAETEKFLADWRLTADELYAENCIGTLREKCHGNGMLLEVQPYGSFPCTTDKVAAACDIPMTEFWSEPTKGPLYADTYATPKVMPAARKAGKALVDAEAFTANPTDGGRWRTSPRDLKVMGDRAFAEGVNRFTFHRFAHQPAARPKLPGMTMGPWGFHFDRTQTWWPAAKEWIAYLTRCQRHLQKGTLVSAQPATNGLVWIRRAYADGMDGFFLALANATNETRTVTLPVTGRFPHVYEPEANRAYRPLIWTDDGTATRVRLTFPAYGSAFVFFRVKPRVDLPVEQELVTESERPLDGAWRVEFPVDWYSGGARTKSVTMTTLADWTTLADPELAYFSGTATYSYDLGKIELRKGERIELDLGAVDVIAEVTVDGRAYPTLWKPPYRLDITDGLRSGRLTVRVTNLWPNRLIGDARLPVSERKTETAWQHWKADDKPLASGLHGPVRLVVRRLIEQKK